MKRNRRLKNGRLKWLIALFAVLLIFAILATDKLVRPIVTNAATTKAEIIITDAVNTSVSQLLHDTGVKYSDIAVISYDNENVISAIEIDTIKLNYIKACITDVIVDEVKKAEKTTLSVPIGTLTKNDYLLGRGPRINFDIDLSVAVSTDYKSEFKKAGINNTLHQIVIEVDANYYITMPWYSRQQKYITSFILAQTVVVGKVPDNFTSVYDGEGDLVGDIFDYGTIND